MIRFYHDENDDQDDDYDMIMIMIMMRMMMIMRRMMTTGTIQQQTLSWNVDRMILLNTILNVFVLIAEPIQVQRQKWFLCHEVGKIMGLLGSLFQWQQYRLTNVVGHIFKTSMHRINYSIYYND